MATRETVRFRGVRGAELAGILHRPDQPRASLVLAHCFTCSKSLKIIARLAEGLEDRGYAVLRFDFTGLGESEGAFAQTTVGTNIGDIIAAAHHLIALGQGPCALVGHSLGGAATLLAARSLPSVKALGVVAAPCSPEHVRNLFAPQDVDEALARGRVDVELAGRRFPITREFLEDLERYPAQQRIGKLGRPLIVVHGLADAIVEPAEGERIFAAAAQPKAFEPVPEGDHFLSGPGQIDDAAGLLAGFFDRMLRPF